MLSSSIQRNPCASAYFDRATRHVEQGGGSRPVPRLRTFERLPRRNPRAAQEVKQDGFRLIVAMVRQRQPVGGARRQNAVTHAAHRRNQAFAAVARHDAHYIQRHATRPAEIRTKPAQLSAFGLRPWWTYRAQSDRFRERWRELAEGVQQDDRVSPAGEADERRAPSLRRGKRKASSWGAKDWPLAADGGPDSANRLFLDAAVGHQALEAGFDQRFCRQHTHLLQRLLQCLLEVLAHRGRVAVRAADGSCTTLSTNLGGISGATP